jgi:ADP-ribose pyrophosphatase
MSRSASRTVICKSRTRIAENQVFDIYFDHIAQPGGQEVPTYLVVAPKTSAANMVTGVSVLPVMDGKVGLLRLYRHAIGISTWEVPRGFVDAGESAEVSAARELDEEAGVRVRPEGLESMGCMTPEGSLLAARVHLFVAHDCEPLRPYQADELGHETLGWFPLEDALAMAHRGEIEDPSTLLLLYRTALDRT